MTRCRIRAVGVVLFLGFPALAEAAVTVCGEYVNAVGEASLAVLRRDGQQGPLENPFEVAEARLRLRPEVQVPDDTANGSVAFRKAFEHLLVILTPENFSAETDRFVQDWSVPRPVLFRMLLPYALYLSGRYAGLAAAMPDRAANERALADGKREEYRVEQPRLEARYRYYLEHHGFVSVREMARTLSAQGTPVTEAQVERELLALFLEVSFALERPLLPTERLALGTGPAVTSAAEACVDATERSLPPAVIASALGMAVPRVAFFRNGARRGPRVAWDRWVKDPAGVRFPEGIYLRRLHAEPTRTQVEIATELNLARGRELGRNLAPTEAAEFRTYASTQAMLREMGLLRGVDRSDHDVYRAGYGAVVARGRLRAPEAVEYLREQLAQRVGFDEIAKDLGVPVPLLRAFDRQHLEGSPPRLPALLARLLEGPKPNGSFSTGEVPVGAKGTTSAAGPTFVGAARPGRDAPAAKASNESTESPRSPVAEEVEPRARPEERRPGPTLSAADRRIPTDGTGRRDPRAAAAIVEGPAVPEEAPVARPRTAAHHVASIVAFALRHERDKLGPKPRLHPKDPRPEEKTLGVSLSGLKGDATKALALLRSDSRYQKATKPQKAMLEKIFAKDPPTVAENVAVIVRFALANEKRAAGPRPRSAGPDLRADEARLAKVLYGLVGAKQQPAAAKALAKDPAYVDATGSQKRMLEALFALELQTVEEHLARLTAFAGRYEKDALGPKPRAGGKELRPGEDAAAKSLAWVRAEPMQLRALEALALDAGFKKASATLKKQIVAMVSEKHLPWQGRLGLIVRFAFRHEHSVHGPRPRNSPTLEPRDDEEELAKALSDLRRERSAAELLTALRADWRYAEALLSQQRLIEGIVLGRPVRGPRAVSFLGAR